MLNMVMGLCRGCGRIWFWHAFLMVCCHNDESLLIANVRWLVYWVTFVCVGGYAVIMACCRLWRPSVSVWFPHMHCSRLRFVMGVPLLLSTSLQLIGSDVIILFSVAGPFSSTSISLGMNGM